MTHHLPQRRSPRLQGYDYSQSGAYFVTICCHQRLHLFGRIADSAIILNKIGEIAMQCWLNIPDHFPSVDLDAFVIMPNHMHGILVLTDGVGTRNCASETCASDNDKTPTLGRVINTYKGAVTRQVRRLPDADPHAKIWQGRYHDHIIRNVQGLNTIRQYVATNTSRWHDDSLYG